MSREPLNVFLIIVAHIALFGCTGAQKGSVQGNAFIQRFIDENSVRIYKSEIQRVKVNYFPAGKMLVYSFWKKEKFESNGDIFLHAYLADSANLLKHRKQHGFVNLAIEKNGIILGSPPFFYMLQNLQLPYDLSSIETGQFNATGKTWKSSFRNTELLKKDTLGIQEMIAGESTFYPIAKTEIQDHFCDHSLRGPMVFRSTPANVSVYFNVNLNRFTYVFENYRAEMMSKTELFIDIVNHSKGTQRRITIPPNAVKTDESKAILTYDLAWNEHFETMNIGQIENGREITWKVLDRKKLIYTSYPIKMVEDTEPLSSEDKNIALLYNLISGNLPLIYYNSNKEFGLYLNRTNKKAYVVTYDANNFDGLNLECTIKESDNFKVKNLNLQNSFFIKGHNKDIVVHEFTLAEGPKTIQMRINSGQQLLFEQTIAF